MKIFEFVRELMFGICYFVLLFTLMLYYSSSQHIIKTQEDVITELEYQNSKCIAPYRRLN